MPSIELLDQVLSISTPEAEELYRHALTATEAGVILPTSGRLSADGQWVIQKSGVYDPEQHKWARLTPTKDLNAEQRCEITLTELDRLLFCGMSAVSRAVVPTSSFDGILRVNPFIEDIQLCSTALFVDEISPIVVNYRSTVSSTGFELHDTGLPGQYSTSQLCAASFFFHDTEPSLGLSKGEKHRLMLDGRGQPYVWQVPYYER